MMQPWLIGFLILATIVALCVIFVFWCRPPQDGQWLGSAAFVAQSGLVSLGALIKGPNLSLIIALQANSELTLCNQDYSCEWGDDATVTLKFLSTTTSLGSGSGLGALIDDGTYSYKFAEPNELVIFDNDTIYLDLVKD